jgi:hypothetical protein
MKMVITLKSGTQISTQVEEYTLGRNPLGGLTKLEWTATESADSRLKYLDLSEVAAVHTEWEPGDNDDEAERVVVSAAAEETS